MPKVQMIVKILFGGDGVYLLRDGKAYEVNTFPWGYEGLANAKDAPLVKYQGENCLWAGPGLESPEVTVIA